MWLRGSLALQAVVMLAFGVLLTAGSHHAGAVWAWPLAPLAAEAIGAWLLGIGGSAAYISLRGDRADLPGAALSYVVLGAIWLAGTIVAGDAFHDTVDLVLYVVFAVSVLVVGVAGAMLSYREGRYGGVARDQPSAGAGAGAYRASAPRGKAGDLNPFTTR